MLLNASFEEGGRDALVAPAIRPGSAHADFGRSVVAALQHGGIY